MAEHKIGNSNTNALELLQSCTKPGICTYTKELIQDIAHFRGADPFPRANKVWLLVPNLH